MSIIVMREALPIEQLAGRVRAMVESVRGMDCYIGVDLVGKDAVAALALVTTHTAEG